MKRFAACEAGAVTIDWVVLTASLVALGVAVVMPLATGALSLGNLVSGHVETVSVDHWH